MGATNRIRGNATTVLLAVILLIPTLFLERADAGVSFIRTFPNDPELYHPQDVATDNLDNVYTVDHYHHLIKYNSEGQPQWVAGGSPSGTYTEEGALYFPAAVAYGNDHVYVVDTGHSKVQVYTTGGSFVTAFGSYGNEPGQFLIPNGIAINPQTGQVYVSDGQANNVSVFDANGNYVRRWGAREQPPFAVPQGLAFDKYGALYVTNEYAHALPGREGVMIFHPPSDVPVGSFVTEENGVASFLDGITVNKEGTTIWLAESGRSRISKWVKKGSGFGDFEREIAFVGNASYPHGVALDGKDHLFVASTNGSQILEYANKAPKLMVFPFSGRDLVSTTSGLWFNVGYNQVDASCQITGRMTVDAPGHDPFKVDGDVAVPANGFVDLKLDLSPKQVKWMKKAWDKGKKVSIDGKLSGPCSDGVKISKKHSEKL